jgi:antitoxin component of MazEF toxin-antitoxin module
MINRMQKKTYKYSDIFKKQEGEEVMTLPPEIIKDLELEPGDNLKILMGDQGTIILEKIDGKE